MQTMSDSSPICRCRVLYLGSAVPRHSKDGLQGIQEPLRCLYPSDGLVAAKGIDSWLSVWSNGILLENVDDNLRHITKFFSIESLHYCAAVRHVMIPRSGNVCSEQRFLPLDSPFAQMPRTQNPPVFAAILRRTTGIKVLECHVFICKREAAANALVRCCFHSYADNSYARQLNCTNMSNPTNSFRGSVILDSTDRTEKCVSPPINCDWRPLSLAEDNCREQNTILGNSNNQSNNREIKCENEAFQIRARSEHNSVNNFLESISSVNKIYGKNKNWNIWEDDTMNNKLENTSNVYSGIWSTSNRPSRARQISVPIRMQPPEAKTAYYKVNKDRKLLKNSLAIDTNMTVNKSEVDSLKYDLDGKIIQMYNTKQFPAINNYCFSTKREQSYHPNIDLHNSSILPKKQLSESLKHPLKNSLKNSQQFFTLQPPLSKNKRNLREYGYKARESNQSHNFSIQQQYSDKTLDMLNNSCYMTNKRKLYLSKGNGLDRCTNRNIEPVTDFQVYRRSGHLNERAFSFSIRQEHRSRSLGSLASFESYNPEKGNDYELSQTVADLDLSDDQENNQIMDALK